MPPTEIDRARFAAGLTRARRSIDDGGEIGLAVSGGPDSLALLLLAVDALPGKVRVATVDHGLRADARREAEMVAAICADLGVEHAILDRTSPGATAFPDGAAGTSVQARARAFRYDLLGRWCGDHGLALLATGHHADDQAETLLMRLSRGAGLLGLSSIRAVRQLATTRPADGGTSRGRVPHGVTIFRPLLRFTKRELGRIVERAGLDPADDPSNSDPRYRRSDARDLLARHPWLRPGDLAASVEHLAAANEALEWVVTREMTDRVVTAEAGVSLAWRGLPDELLRRIVRAILTPMEARLRGIPDDQVDLRDPTVMIERLKAGRHATLGRIMAAPGPEWQFRPAPPHRVRQA